MNFLFLRGLGRNSNHWHGFQNQFKTETNQIICLDTLGNGEFSDLDSPISISEQTNFLRLEFLKRKSNNDPWVIISISMGSMIALDWIHRYPQDFVKVFCMNTSSKDVLWPHERFNLHLLFQIPFLIFSKKTQQEKTILQLTVNQLVVNDELVNQNVMASKMACTKLNFFKQLISAARFKSPVEILVPVIFLASKNDRLVNFKGSLKLAQKYQQKIFINDHSGHDLPLDDKSWALSIIKQNL